MKKLAIYGAGGFGRETLNLVREINLHFPTWEMLGFFDDQIPKGTMVNDEVVLGNFEDLNTMADEIYLVLAIARPMVKKNIIDALTNPKINFANLIHPSVTNKDFQKIHLGKGIIITAGVILTVNINIGDHVIINLASTIGHDVMIGKYSSIMPGVRLSGNVILEEGTYLGTGAILINNLSIGAYATIGAGAVVIHDIKPNITAVGVPAKQK